MTFYIRVFIRSKRILHIQCIFQIKNAPLHELFPSKICAPYFLSCIYHMTYSSFKCSSLVTNSSVTRGETSTTRMDLITRISMSLAAAAFFFHPNLLEYFWPRLLQVTQQLPEYTDYNLLPIVCIVYHCHSSLGRCFPPSTQ